MRFAIIDLGSNSIRMNIVEIMQNKATILKDIRRVVRLSEGMAEDNTLKTNAVNRTLTALCDFKRIIDENGVEKVRAIATAAMRHAINKELILEPAKELGIEFEIITGEKEAYYDYLAVKNTLEVKDCVIIDIGGASTEIILVKDGVNVNQTSIPMAAVNITERYFSSTVATDEEMKNAIDDFTEKLQKIEWLKYAKNLDVVGLGGTIRAFAYMYCDDLVKLHGFTMDTNDVLKESVILAKMPLEQRILIESLGKERADIVLGGMVPLISVLNYLDSKKLVTSIVGLREGVMYDIIKE